MAPRRDGSRRSWDPFLIVSQIVGLQACHYLVLCLITPPLLVLFANPLALELEGGPANVAMIMDWREMTGRAVLDDRIGEYTRLPSSLGRDPSGGVARIPGFGGSAGGTSPSSGDRVSIGDDGLVHPGPEAFRAYEASEASEAAAAAAASSRRPHRRRQLAASPSGPRLAKQDKREARQEEEKHRAVALPDSPLALMHEAQQQEDRSEQNSASSAREDEGESGKGQAQQSSADPKRGWTIGLSWMLASSIDIVYIYYLIRRPTHILDFSLTLVFNHIVLTTYYASSFPTSLFFWAIVAGSAAMQIIWAEQLCVRREMQDGFQVGQGWKTDAREEDGLPQHQQPGQRRQRRNSAPSAPGRYERIPMLEVG